jgi:rhodanese-related sulfurtransferase
MKLHHGLIAWTLLAALAGCTSTASKGFDERDASVEDAPGSVRSDTSAATNPDIATGIEDANGSVRSDAPAVAGPDGISEPIHSDASADATGRTDASAGPLRSDALADATDAGCAGWTALQRLSPAEAKALIETTDPIVINVHIPYEGHIPGTDTSIPYDDVDAIEQYLDHDHCADVLLVCRSDHMSQLAGNELVKRGYLRMRDLKGGFVAWEAAGYPLLKDGAP